MLFSSIKAPQFAFYSIINDFLRLIFLKTTLCFHWLCTFRLRYHLFGLLHVQPNNISMIFVHFGQSLHGFVLVLLSKRHQTRVLMFSLYTNYIFVIFSMWNMLYGIVTNIHYQLFDEGQTTLNILGHIW